VNNAIGGRCWTQSKKQSSDERKNSEKDGASHHCLLSRQTLAPTNPFSSKR
jgi:hypothetical protein